jgi:hypothetical protein
MYRDYTSNHDVRPRIAEALSNERLYEDGEPSLGNAISANSQRLETAAFLEKCAKENEIAGDLFKYIAERLASCEPGRRCLSGACPSVCEQCGGI